MDGNSETKRPRQSNASMALVLAAGRERGLALARHGIDSLETLMKETSLESVGVFEQFLKTYPDIAKEFLRRAGSEMSALRSALSQRRLPEPQPDPPKLREDPTEEQRKLYAMSKRSDDERREKGEAAAFSGPLKVAIRASRDGLREGAEYAGVGPLVVALLTVESNAQIAFYEASHPTRRDDALAWLRAQPDPEGEVNLVGDVKAHHRAVVDAVWPSIQAKMSDPSSKLRQAQEQEYDKNPSRYEDPLDVARELAKRQLDQGMDYSWRGGVLLHAAANEARIRHAPEATLDHLLFALLRDDTDAAVFLDSCGVDREDWSRRLDAALPRYAEGPRWPPKARDLNMSIHLNRSYRFKPLPDGKQYETLSKEERKEYVERVVDTEIRFTDLRYLANVPDEPKSFAFLLFAEAGITADELRAGIVAREKGDVDWWKKPFDLVVRLDAVQSDTFRDGKFEKAAIIVEAARHEARLRHAPHIDFDDLLVALLVPGTDLFNLLQSLENDPVSVRELIDALRPGFPEGPMFPETEELTLNPAGASLTREGFSDLLFLRRSDYQKDEESPGLRLLREHGITPDVVEARLAQLGVEPF